MVTIGALLASLLFCSAAPLSNPAVDQYNVHVGTQTFAGLYKFTTNNLLSETAQAIQGMGSDTIKLYLGSNYPRQYLYALAPNVTNLLTLTRDDPSCRSVLDGPFRNIIAWAYPFSNSDAPFGNGAYTPGEQANDYRELYDLARYLLTNYNNSGKTFYLGHWEGDGYLSVNNWSTNPTPAVLQGMIAWENNRQKAIDDAKAGLLFTNVNVFYYAEANRVRDAMLNGPANNQRLINMVVPYITNLDFLSYSSYDAMDLDSTSLYATLDYITSKLPSGKSAKTLGQRVWIGEYGWGGLSTAAQEPVSRAYIQKLLAWGPRFILFWEIYNNEANRNFCLIDPSGIKVPCYYLHQRFINQSRLAVARFQETYSRLPTDSEFSALLRPVLNQPLPAPVSLSLSNLPPQVTNDSVTLSGRLSQGIYADDQATVWLFWGTQDGGTVRANWQSSRLLGTNTRFNPKTFNTAISYPPGQTNFYFRFYATNATGEAWAPVSSSFRTETLRSADFGYKMKIDLPPGYAQTGTLLNFPVLVVLGTNLPGFNYNQFASANGEDLRFSDASGASVIPHEIDEWNTAGTSYVWVQVPQLTGTNDSIWAYWGNPLAAETPLLSTADTWAPDYKAVWHLKEIGFPYADSAQHAPVLVGNPPVSVPGLIGHAVGFDGSAQFLDAGALNLANAFTVSAWVKLDPAASGIQTICANKKGGWNSDGFALYVNTYQTSDHKFILETGNGTNGQSASTPADLITLGVWHNLAAVVDKATASARLFVDGVDRTQIASVQPDFNTQADLNVGRFTDGTFHFTGAMDEFRLQAGSSSAAWLSASWQSVVQNNSFLAYGPVLLQPLLLYLSSPAGVPTAAWSASGVGRVLESATNLTFPTFWVHHTNLPALISGQWQIRLPPDTNHERFFRLAPP